MDENPSDYTTEAFFGICNVRDQVEAELKCEHCGNGIPKKARNFVRIQSVAHSILTDDKPPHLGVNSECGNSKCQKIHLGVQLPIRQKTGKLWCVEDVTVNARLDNIPTGCRSDFGKKSPPERRG